LSQTYFNLGNAYFCNLEYRNAKETFLKALKTKPNSVDINFAMANTCLKIKDYPEAIRYFKIVVQNDRAEKSDKYLKALEALGDIYLNSNKDSQRAEKVFKKIIQHYPDNEFAKASLQGLKKKQQGK
jgi:tetratricopeptide (TPR) repeat protein